MQKKENVNIQLEEEQKQEQEHIFIGDHKLKEYYDWSRKNVNSLLISLALFFLIIPLSVLIALGIIWAKKSLSVNLDDADISKSDSILGVLCLFLLPAFTCGLISNLKIKNKYPNIVNK